MVNDNLEFLKGLIDFDLGYKALDEAIAEQKEIKKEARIITLIEVIICGIVIFCKIKFFGGN